jgi:hypothetical protein
MREEANAAPQAGNQQPPSGNNINNNSNKPGLFRKILQRAAGRRQSAPDISRHNETEYQDQSRSTTYTKSITEEQLKPPPRTPVGAAKVEEEDQEEDPAAAPAPDDFQQMMQNTAQTEDLEREEMLRTITRRSGRQPVELNHPDLGMDMSMFQQQQQPKRDKGSGERGGTARPRHGRTMSSPSKQREAGRERTGLWFLGGRQGTTA